MSEEDGAKNTAEDPPRARKARSGEGDHSVEGDRSVTCLVMHRHDGYKRAEVRTLVVRNREFKPLCGGAVRLFRPPASQTTAIPSGQSRASDMEYRRHRGGVTWSLEAMEEEDCQDQRRRSLGPKAPTMALDNFAILYQGTPPPALSAVASWRHCIVVLLHRDLASLVNET